MCIRDRAWGCRSCGRSSAWLVRWPLRRNTEPADGADFRCRDPVCDRGQGQFLVTPSRGDVPAIAMIFSVIDNERRSRRVLLAGGAGFIGSHLCDALLARGDSVTVVDNPVSY